MDLLAEHLLSDAEDAQSLARFEAVAVSSGEMQPFYDLLQRVLEAGGPTAVAYGRMVYQVLAR